ncbi:MAG: 3'(2'),5'-bisphosphate nucleotidase CysQ, partial [Pseudomonadota bacterium]
MPETDRTLPSYTDERDALIKAARAAGDVIMPLFRKVGLDVWEKDDRSPVSEADMAANSLLQEVLLS